jgi:hypothetical protein
VGTRSRKKSTVEARKTRGKKGGEQAKASGKATETPKPAKDEGSKRKRRRGSRRGSKETEAPKVEQPVTQAREAEVEGDTKRRKRGSRGRAKKKKDEGKAVEGSKPTVTYIVDGSNVALEARTFKEGGRLRQLELIMDKLEQEKGAAVTVIVDANLRHHIDRKDDLEVMIKDRRVLQAPAQTDADEFILLTAEAHRSRGEKVVIISNDRYQDYLKRFKPRFDWVKDAQRRFMFVFSHDGSNALEAMVSLN